METIKNWFNEEVTFAHRWGLILFGIGCILFSKILDNLINS